MKKFLLFLVALLYFTTSEAQIVTIGTGTSINCNTCYPAPYGNWYWGAKHQFLIRASELTSACALSGNITSLAFNVATAQGTPLTDFTIRMKATAATVVTSTFDNTGFTTVYGPQVYTETAGWNTHTFSTPFNWNGTSNILIEVCFNNASYTNNAQTYYSTTAFQSSVFYRSDAAGVCANATGTTSSDRPNMRLAMVTTVNPVMKPSKNIINFDTVFVGYSKKDSVYIRNIGCSNLTISNITKQTSNYSFTPSSGTVIPGDSLKIVVTFTPLPTGLFKDTLKVFSNAGDSLIALRGVGALQPIISVAPPSFNVTINSCNDSITQPLTINNTGSSNLYYNIMLGSSASGAKLYDGFESGGFASWNIGSGVYTRTVTTTNPANGLYSFQLIGGNGVNYDGVNHTFASSTPNYVSYKLMSPVGSSGWNCGVGVGRTSDIMTNQGVADSWIDNGSMEVYLYCSSGTYTIPLVQGQWYLFEYRNINYSSKTFDYYINGTLIAPNLIFWNTNITSIDVIHLMGWDTGEISNYDEIIIGSELPTAWLFPSPTSGTSIPSGSSIVNVKFKSTNVVAGIYYGNVLVNSNDPATPQVIVPCTLTVNGAPNLIVSIYDLTPPCVDFDSIMAYTTSIDSILLSNTGCDTLRIDSLKISPSVFTIVSSPLKIAPYSSSKINMQFSPVAAGTFSGTLNIYTNDLDTAICLQGKAYARPIIGATPASYTVTLACSDTLQDTLTISNTGGSDLIFDLGLNSSPLAACGVITTGYCCGMGIYNVTFNTINNNSADGSTGYQNFTSISTTVAAGTSYNLSVQTGVTYSENVRAWIDYNNNGVFEVSELVLADLNTLPNRFHTTTVTIPTSATQISALRMRIGSDYQPNSPPASCSNVQYGQYEDYTIFIQDWLIGGPPTADTIVPSGSIDIPLEFISTGLIAGQYTYTISVNTNDPLNNPVLVPCTLNVVGTADFELVALGDTIAPLCLDLDSIMAFTTSTDTIFITNLGCDTLWLDSLKFSPSVFSLDTASSFILPGDFGGVVVLFSPVAAGNYSGTINIYTNDLDTAICIYGEAFPSPTINLTPDTFNITLGCNDSITDTLFILNSGGGPLNWTISTGTTVTDDFDPAINATLWSFNTGIANTDCGSVFGNALWMGDNVTRIAATNDIITSGGGTVSFYLKIAGTGGNCESADGGEDVVLEYSNNGGGIWTQIALYNENGYPNFTLINQAIPPAAQTLNTRFRWRQLSFSGSCCDHWALDNVSISTVGNCGAFVCINPTTGTTPPATTDTAYVEFNSTGLLVGQYIATITITSNDPFNNPLFVPCTLNVVGTADFQLYALADTIAPLCLDLDSIMEFTTSMDSIGITNTGCDTLWLDSLIFSPAEFSLVANDPYIIPDDTGGIVVQFAPTSVGNFTGTLSLYTNDLDTVFCLKGKSFPRPIETHNPDTFFITLACADTINDTLTIYNTGINDLIYSTFTIDTGRSALFDGVNDYMSTVLNIDQGVTSPGATFEAWVYPTSNSAGRHQVISSDNGGFDWGILREAGLWYVFSGATSVNTGFTVDLNKWQHIAGVFIPGTGIRFYKNGVLFSSASIGLDASDDNIWVGSNSGGGEYFAGRIDEARVWNIQRSQGQIISTMTKRLFGNETGLRGYWNYDNGTAIDVSQYGFNGTFANGAAASLPNSPVTPSWMSYTSIVSDTIVNLDSTQVPFTWTSTGLTVGQYTSGIIINSNDPLASPDTVPIIMNVIGAPKAEFFLLDSIGSCLDLDSIMEFTTSTDTIVIFNTGCDTLFIDSLKFSPAIFSSVYSASYILPGDTNGVVVQFAPIATGTVTGTITIYTNDVDPIICLNGEGFARPIISLVPDTFNITLGCNDSITDTLLVINTGGSDLIFELEGGGTQKINVALVAGEASVPYRTDVQTKLMSTGKFNLVDMYDASAMTPTLAQLMAYDAVLVWRNNGFSNATMLGDNLADYVDAGGGVVTAIFANGSSPIAGRFTSGDYWCLTPGGQTSGGSQTLGTVYLPNHPVMKNVVSFSGGSDSWRNNNFAINASATRVADWSDGRPLVAVRTKNGTNRVDLGMFPPSSDQYSGFWTASTDGELLMANALHYSANGGVDWMTLAPEGDTTAANDTSIISVEFNSSGLVIGTYTATIVVNSNDPLNPSDTIPVTLTVTGTANFQLAGLGDTITPLCLDLDSIMEYTTSTDTIYITNTGCDTLFLDSLIFSPAVFTVDTFTAFIEPGDTGGVVVLFSPVAAGTFSGTVNIYTNDLDTAICLYGEVFARPTQCHFPDTFNISLGCCDSTTQPLLICNSGGSNLTYTLTVNGTTLGSKTQVAVYNHPTIAAMLNTQPDIQATAISTYDASTLVNYDVLMNIRNSNLNQADVLNWINNGGTWISEWSSNPFPISSWGAITGTAGGNASGSISVSINDASHYLAQNINWASMPVGANPCDYMYDLNITDPAANTIINVNHSAYGVNPLLVEKKYGQGKILLFNWDYQDSPNYNAVVQDMIQEVVRYGGSKPEWISLDTTAGIVLPGDTDSVQVSFNSCGLIAGQYTATIELSTNDPLNSVDTISLILNVNGTAELNLVLADTIAPMCLDLDSIMEFTTSTDTIYLANTGCDTLFIDSMITSPAVFSVVSSTSPILMGDNGYIVVQFAPTSTNSFSGTLNLFSNDLDTVICLYGESYARPIQCHNPNSFNPNFSICQDSILDTLNVCNTGAGNLNYSLWSPSGRNVVFDGVNDNINLGTWFNLQTFTIEMWVKPGATQVQYADIIDNNHTGARSWVLQQNNTTTNQYSWGTNDGASATLFNLTANQWTHISLVRDGSLKLDRVYINGSLLSSFIGTTNIPYDGTQFLRLGRWGGGARNWNGKMDEVKIYNKALSQAEIISTMSSTLTGTENGLIGYWNFDDSTATDLSPNTNNGTLINGAFITSPNVEFLPASTGTVTPAGTYSIQVIFRKAGLPFGTTNFPIYLSSNDPLNAVDTINVSMFIDSVPPAAPVANDTNVCFGNPTPPLIANGNPGDTIRWYSDAALTTLIYTGSSFVSTQTVVGTYTYYVTSTDSVSGCASQADTVYLYINTAPLEPTASDASSCFGNPTPTLISSGTIIQWYTSLPPTTPVGTGPYSTGLTAAGTYTFFVTDSTGGCPESVADTVILSIYALPNKPLAKDTIVCFGGPIPPLTATVTGTDSIRWYNTAMVFQASGDTFNTGQTAAGTYTYYVTSVDTVTNCESVRDTAKLTINNTSQPTANNVSSCFGSPTPPLVATPNNSIQWYDNLMNPIAANDTLITGQTVVGTYTYYVTQTLNGCASNPTMVTLTINPIPVTPTAPDKSSCFGSPTPALTATGTNIKWYSNPTLTTLVGTGSPYNTGLTAVGTYTYYVTQTASGCPSLSDTVYLNIYALPVRPVATNTFICFGNPTPDLVATNITGNDTVHWYSNPTLTPIVYTGNPFATTQTAVATYTYYVTQTDTATGCRSNSDTVTLTINAAPLEPTANDATVCFGFPVPPLSSTGTIPQWYNNPALTPVLFAGSPYNTGITAVGTYTYYVTDSIAGCPQSTADTALLTINPIPAAPLASNDTAICFGDATPDLIANIVNTQWYDAGMVLVFTGDTFATGLTAAGTYTFYAGQTVLGCQSAKDTVHLTINFTPAPVANNVSSPFGSPTPDLSSTGTNVQWYDTSGAMVFTGNPFTTGQTAVGTYTYYVTQTLNNCESTQDTALLTIYPGAPLGTDTFTCFGQLVPDLIATGTNIQWWSNSALTILAGTGSPFATGQTAAGTYTYYVTQTVNFIQSPSDTVTLTITPLPLAPTSTNQSACFGGTIPDLTAAGTNIQWYDDTPALVFTGSPFATGETAVGTYTYTATQTVNGCEGPADTVTLTINALPAPPIASNDTAICFGDPTPNLTASGTNISWYDGLGNFITTSSTFPPGVTAPGVYVYYATQTNTVTTCESLGDTVTLTINSAAPPVAPDVAVCFGLPVPPLTATGTSIEWYDNLGNPVFSGSPFNTGQTAVGTYTYYVTQTNTVTTCSSPQDTVYLTISSQPALAPTVSDTDACFGSLIPDLNATTGTIINWYDDAALTNQVFSGNPFPTGQTAIGTYTFYATDSTAGCPEGPSTSVLLVINALPATLAVNDTAICFGSSTPDLIAVGTNISWYDTSMVLVSSNDTFATGQTAVGTYTYYVTQTNIGTGCSSIADSVILTINILPSIPIALDTVVCSAATIPNLTSTGTNVQWYDTSGAFVFTGNSYSTGQTSVGVHTYYVTQLDGITGCESAADTSTLTILLSPPVPIANNVAVCAGNPIPPLTSTGTNVNWYSNAALTTLVNTGNTFNTGQITPGVYTYWVTDSLTGCVSSSADSVTLTINNLPVEPNANDVTLCYGNPAVLTATGTTPQWYGDVTLISMVGTGSPFNTGITAVGTYNYYVTDYAAGCGNSPADTAVLTINPAPLVTANTYSTTILLGNSTTLTAYNAVTYAWAPPTGLNTTTGQTVVATPSVTTTYTVTGTNQYGCSNSKTILVVVNPLGVASYNEPVQDVNIYPNPAIGSFTLEFNSTLETPIDIYMLNMLGERVNVMKSDEVQGGGLMKHKYLINTNTFTEGVYTIEIVTEKGTVNRRVVLFR